MYDAVVTGCAGFVGSHLSEALADRGERVLGIDSFDDYYSPERKLANLERLAEERRFALLRGDLREIPLEKFLDRDVTVYHLAAQPGVRGSWGANFGHYVENNVLATQELLEALLHARGKPRMVYASSSSVYGEPAEGATREDSPTHPISPYGMTKLAGEQLVRLYGRSRGMSTVALRFFTVYGPRQRPDMAFHRFFRALEEDTPIEVFGDGQQMRDFTYVSDIVAGILAAADSDEQGEVFNLGGGAPVPLLTAIRYLGDAAGTKPKVRHLQTQPGDPRRTWADIRRARRALKFRPRVSLREGLAHQSAWQEAGAPRAAVAA
jgi:nucleoside-diphosphate-sugar epimerase